MRYMMMVRANTNCEAGQRYEKGEPPDPKLLEVITRQSEDMAKSGVLLETGYLLPSSNGARIRVARGKLNITDGPFTESKELIGGYAILRAGSKEEAIEMARLFMQLHVDVLGPSYQGEMEIRELADPPGNS